MTYKVLNLYACLGGNRYKWSDCEVTAVELDPELARMYHERFPQDKVIIADAHQYLLDHFKEFDFIWSSPPCPSHSMTNTFLNSKGIIRYPDMGLYQEIIFLKTFFKGKFCVENVKPYYDPLIPAQKRGRHLYWCNFKLPNILSKRDINGIMGKSKDEHKILEEFHQIKVKSNLGGYRDILRNLVDYEAGLTIFNTARNIYNKSKLEIPTLF